MEINSLNKITKDFISSGIENISIADVKKVISREQFIRGKIIDSPTLNQYLPKFDLMMSYLQKSEIFLTDKDEAFPIKTVAFALNYLDDIGDFISDFNKLDGYVYDEQIFVHCYKSVVHKLNINK